MMRRKILTISLVTLTATVILVSAVYFLRENKTAAGPTTAQVPKASSDATAREIGADATRSADAPAAPKASKGGTPQRVVHPFPEVLRSREGMPLETDPFMAKSVAEQQWLDRNGYPNEAHWRALMRANYSQLEQAALAGDQAAQVVLNQKKLIGGDDSAIEDTLELGAEGSGFAIEMLASTLAGPLQDPVSAYAILRAGEMRGNYRSGPGRETLFSVPLTSAQRAEGEAEAMEVFRQLARLRESRGGSNGPLVDPRPVDP